MGLLDGLGGGGGGGLLSMLDPLGLLGGGKQGGAEGAGAAGAAGGAAGGGDSLQKLFDPLGIFPALQGEIDKAAHPDGVDGDASLKESAQKFTEYTRLGQDIATDFKEADGTEPPPNDDANKQVKTEFVPAPGDQGGAANGYADSARMKQDAATGVNADQKPDPKEDPKTNVPDPEAVKQAELREQQHQKDLETLEHLQELSNNFGWIQKGHEGDTDGWADMEHNIDTILAKKDELIAKGAGGVVEAAQFLKDNPDVWRRLVGLSGSENNCISQTGIKALKDILEGTKTEQSQQSATGDTTKTGGTGDSNKTGGTGDSKKTGDSHVDVKKALTDADNAGRNGFLDSSKSVEDRILNGGTSYIKSLDAQIEGLLSQGALDSGDQQKLQFLMQKRTEMFTTVSNIMKMFHDMAMTPINHLR